MKALPWYDKFKKKYKCKNKWKEKGKGIKMGRWKDRKLGKYISAGQQVTERVENLTQRQRKEKGKTRKREIKLAKEGTMKETMCQTQ